MIETLTGFCLRGFCRRLQIGVVQLGGERFELLAPAVRRAFKQQADTAPLSGFAQQRMLPRV